MAEEVAAHVEVDQGRILEILKKRFASHIANLEHQNAMLQVATEELIKQRDEAVEDNTRLRSQLNSPHRE